MFSPICLALCGSSGGSSGGLPVVALETEVPEATTENRTQNAVLTDNDVAKLEAVRTGSVFVITFKCGLFTETQIMNKTIIDGDGMSAIFWHGASAYNACNLIYMDGMYQMTVTLID